MNNSTDISYLTENMAVWLFGGGVAWLLLLSGAVFAMKLEQVKTRVAMDIFIDGLGEKLAKALHADDDYFRIDALLDKYIDRNYEMSLEEWNELNEKCEAILANKENPTIARSLAGMLSAVCDHKLKVKYGQGPTLPADPETPKA